MVPGTELDFVEENGTLVARRVTVKEPLGSLVGLLARTDVDAVLSELRGPAWNSMDDEVITAVDTSVLLDVLTNDPLNGMPSLSALRAAAAIGQLVVCPIVWAELAGSFDDPHVMLRSFAEAHIAFDPFDRMCADLAGAHWRAYRRQGGSRTRLIADFLLGAARTTPRRPTHHARPRFLSAILHRFANHRRERSRLACRALERLR